MDLFCSTFSQPLGFVTDKYCCFPTDSAYYESDFEAVMASKHELRIWSDSDWPSDIFTKEENREDLKLHEEDNRKHQAWGYMIYNCERTHCYGSLYINPVSSLQENYTVSRGDSSLFNQLSGRLDYWVRADDVEAEKEITVLVKEWIEVEWKVRIGFIAREGMTKRKKIYQLNNFQEVLILKNRITGTALSLYL